MSNSKIIGKQRRVDPVEVARMLKAGQSQADAARHFGVTRAAINQVVKKLSHAKTSEVALRAAPQVIAMDLKAIEQFTTINKETQTLLYDLRNHLDGNRKLKISDGVALSLLLRTIGELRNQLTTQQKMLEVLVNFDEIQSFQKTVISVLYDVCSVQQRKEIVSRLQQNRLVRKSLKFERS